MKRHATATAIAAALALSSASTKAAPFHVVRVRAADVPVVEVEPAVRWREQSSDFFPDLAVEEHMRPERDFGLLARPRLTDGKGNAAVVRVRNLVNPQDHQSHLWLRFLQIGDASPLTMACQPSIAAERGVDAYLLEASRPEGPRYRYVEAWLDSRTCRGRQLRQYTTAVVPIAGGAAYAYRSRCPTCEGPERSKLHVILPNAQTSGAHGDGAFFRYWTYLIEHVELPLARGTAATLRAQIDARSIHHWNRVIPTPLPLEDVEIRVETSFASGEHEPTIVVGTRRIDIPTF